MALKKPATQSSTYDQGDALAASRAVDGDSGGGTNTLSHTNLDPEAWWQVDLEKDQSIHEIKLWNRKDCCTKRLSNYHLIISETPLPDRPLTAAEMSAPGVWSTLQADTAGRPTTIPVGASGRYVRVQLAGEDYLAINELEVFTD